MHLNETAALIQKAVSLGDGRERQRSVSRCHVWAVYYRNLVCPNIKSQEAVPVLENVAFHLQFRCQKKTVG